MYQNPYIAGNPIGGETGFFGREDIFREIRQLLSDPNDNARVLYGQRRIGKTSILLQLERRLNAEKKYKAIYFDLHPYALTPLSKVLYELTQRIGDAVQLRPPRESNTKESKEYFRKEILPQIKSDEEGKYFREKFLPEVEKDNPNLVLLFDEFDVLDTKDKEMAIKKGNLLYITRLMSQFPAIKFVFVIGKIPEDLKTLPSFLRGVVYTSVPSILDFDATEQLIRSSETNPPSLQWTPETIQQVWRWTQGHPCVTQNLCWLIWNQIYHDTLGRAYEQAPTVESRQVNAAIPATLEQCTSDFNVIWDGLSSAEKITMSVLAPHYNHVISNEQTRKAFFENNIRLITPELWKAQRTLCERELLRQTETGDYHIVIPLWGKWVTEYKPFGRVKGEVDNLSVQALLMQAQYTTDIDEQRSFYEKVRQLQSIEQIINAFNSDTNPFFIIYGYTVSFEEKVNELRHYFQRQSDILYWELNLKETKHDTLEDTIFEIVRQFIDQVLRTFPEADVNNRLQAHQLLYSLENLRRKRAHDTPDDKLGQFMSFAELLLYPTLETIWQTDRPVVIGLLQFEAVIPWSAQIYNYVLESLQKRWAKKMRFVVFARNEHRPRLFYGSGELYAANYVTFYPLASQ